MKKLTAWATGAVRQGWDSLRALWAWSQLHYRRVVIAAAVVLALILAFPEQTRNHWSVVSENLLPAGAEGLILLETPQVFTRQRLVNDRALEQAWLDEQLQRTSELIKAGSFAKPDFIRFARRNFSLVVGARDAKSDPKADAKAEAKADDARSRLAALGLTVPPIEQFEDAVRYRETIRNALMTTALDDRHDIEGNTVYRFNFNVSVLPPKGSDHLAVVVVDVAEKGRHRTAQAELRRAYVELLHDWTEKLHEHVRRITDDRMNTFERDDSLELVENNQFQEWLMQETEREFLTLKGVRLSSLDLAVLQERYRDSLAKQQLSAVRQTFETRRGFRLALAGARTKVEQDGLLQFAASSCRSNQIELKEFLSPELLKQHKIPEAEQTGPCLSTAPAFAGLDILDALKVIQQSRESIDASCFDSRKGLLELVRAAAQPTPRGPEDPRPTRCESQGDALFATRAATNLYKRRYDLMGTFVVGHVLQKTARSQIPLPASPREQTRFDRLRDYLSQTTAPEPKQQFDIQLRDFFTSQPPSAYCTPGTCIPRILIRDEQQVPERLIEILDQRTAAFTYAVTPNKAVLRSDVTRRGGSDVQAGTDKAGVPLQAQARSDTEDSGLERDATIIGFGDWETAWGQAADGRPRRKNSTRFGWAMFPRPVIGGAARRHAPESHSVSALISIPGWWRMAHLTVATCWISEADLRSTTNLRNVCPDQGNGSPRRPYGLDIRLPGEAQELMHNLRFEVVRYPFLDRVESEQRIEVGRSADILILGGRLWRSPMVRLGSQKANSIEVLPDMKGIVAHFKCVQPQPGTRGVRKETDEATSTATSPAVLEVITSEGKTRAPLPLLVHPFTDRAGYPLEAAKQDVPCWTREVAEAAR